MLSKEIPLLIEQVNSLENQNFNLQKIRDLQSEQLSRSIMAIESADRLNSTLRNDLTEQKKKTNKWRNWTIGGCTVSVGMLILFLTK